VTGEYVGLAGIFHLRVPCRAVVDMGPDGQGRSSCGRNDIVSHSQRAAVDGTRERGRGLEGREAKGDGQRGLKSLDTYTSANPHAAYSGASKPVRHCLVPLTSPVSARFHHRVVYGTSTFCTTYNSRTNEYGNPAG